MEERGPIQYEDRYVNPQVFPHYLEQDFALETPNNYMVRLAPIQRAEFRIYARKPDAQVRRHRSRVAVSPHWRSVRRRMDSSDPCGLSARGRMDEVRITVRCR